MTSNNITIDDAEHFRQCRETFAQREKAVDIFTDWTVTVFHDTVLTKIAHDGTNGPGMRSGQLQVLSVGSGTGEIDYLFLQQIAKKYANIYFTSLELSQDNLNSFKSIVSRGNLKGITWDWKQLTWEHFRYYNIRKCSQPRLFHFIFSVFSITYANDVNTTVMNMYESIDDGGVLLIIVLSDESAPYRLRTKFPKMFASDSLASVSSSEIRKVLDTHGIPFEHTRQPSRVDITPAFTKGRREGANLADHLSRKVNFLKKGEPKLVNEFMAYLKGPDCVEREQQEYLLINDWDAFVVTK